MSSNSKPADFVTTCWSDVRRAAALQGGAADALEQLCRQYWYPLYAYLRRSGNDPQTAQDHVQSFFADLLSRRSLQHADPERGRFRSFLLTACRNHVANAQRAQRTLRRGGGRRMMSLDAVDGETRYAAERSDQWTAERLYERRWALAVIDAAFHRVRIDYEAKGRSERFNALRPLVAPSERTPALDDVAAKLGCSAGAVKVAAHRLRQQFAQALRDEVARTMDVAATDQSSGAGDLAEVAIQQELNELMAALRGEKH